MICIRVEDGMVVVELDSIHLEIDPFSAREIGEAIFRKGCEADDDRAMRDLWRTRNGEDRDDRPGDAGD